MESGSLAGSGIFPLIATAAALIGNGVASQKG